jgi:hypothetical protein
MHFHSFSFILNSRYRLSSSTERLAQLVERGSDKPKVRSSILLSFIPIIIIHVNIHSFHSIMHICCVWEYIYYVGIEPTPLRDAIYSICLMYECYMHHHHHHHHHHYHHVIHDCHPLHTLQHVWSTLVLFYYTLSHIYMHMQTTVLIWERFTLITHQLIDVTVIVMLYACLVSWRRNIFIYCWHHHICIDEMMKSCF